MKLFLSIVIILFFALSGENPVAGNNTYLNIHGLQVSPFSNNLQAAYLPNFIDDQDNDNGGAGFCAIILAYAIIPVHTKRVTIERFLTFCSQTNINSLLTDLPPPVFQS